MTYNKNSGFMVSGGINNIVTKNNIKYNLYGISVGNYKAATFTNNRIIGNRYQAYNGDKTGYVNAMSNYWGCSTAPTKIYGLFYLKPWLTQ